VLFQKGPHRCIYLRRAAMPHLDRQSGVQHVAKHSDQDPGAGEETGASGASHDAASPEAMGRIGLRALDRFVLQAVIFGVGFRLFYTRISRRGRSATNAKTHYLTVRRRLGAR
jgi:hypothetical protein